MSTHKFTHEASAVTANGTGVSPTCKVPLKSTNTPDILPNPPLKGTTWLIVLTVF